MKEALFWKPLKEKAVLCQLCPRNCTIGNWKSGVCGVRENQNGKLVSLVYRMVCSMAVDPIEKKPLFHFAPGTQCLSIATVGCNLLCKFCQNWEISHPSKKEILGEYIEPEKVVELAKNHSVPGIAYTYTEPTVFYEFALDTMKAARKEGLYNIWVSNGYTNPEPAKKAGRYLDAINVDLKGDMEFYQKLCGIPGEEPVKKALKIYKERGVWIEITTLVIPGYNDDEKTISGIVEWVRKNLGADTPIHFSRFFPSYKLTYARPTPVKTLEKAADIAGRAGMKYVYIGNLHAHPRENTYCPKCGAVAIKRDGYRVAEVNVACLKCGEKILVNRV